MNFRTIISTIKDAYAIVVKRQSQCQRIYHYLKKEGWAVKQYSRTRMLLSKESVSLSIDEVTEDQVEYLVISEGDPIVRVQGALNDTAPIAAATFLVTVAEFAQKTLNATPEKRAEVFAYLEKLKEQM